MASDRIRRNSGRGVVVLVDTNALFMMFEQHIRLEEELHRLLGAYDIFIVQQIADEISFLQQNGTGKQQHLAKTTLSFIKRYPVVPGIKSSSIDDSLLQTAKHLSAVVVTNDKELRKKCKKESIKTICLQGKNRLIVE